MLLLGYMYLNNQMMGTILTAETEEVVGKFRAGCG